jgi:CRP/FNR family transcriptional regulator
MPASTVWLLVKGHVKLSMAGPRDTTRVVDLVSADRTPGAVLDPLGLGLDLHVLTGEALTDVQVCGISRADAMRILSEEPGLAVRLLTELSQRMTGLVRSFGHDLGGRVRERLARTLLDVGERHGVRTPEGITLALELQRQEWAELVGTSRETVVRLLTGFCREGLISVQGRRITLRDPDRLARLA